MRSVAAWAWRRLQSTSSLLPRPAGLRATAGTCAPTAPEICAGKWHQSSSFTWSTPRGKAPPGEHISSQVAAPRSRERPDGNPAGPFESPGSGRLGDTAKALKDLAAAQSSEAVAAAVERAGGPASLPPGVLAKALQALARCRASRDPTVLRHSLLQRLEREIALRAGCFVAHDITACAAALAKLGLGNAAVFTALQRRAMELQADLSPRWKSHTSDGDSLAWFGQDKMAPLPPAEPPGVPLCLPKDVALVLWAFARAGRAAPELFEALGSRAMGRLAQHNTSDLAQITWAAAKAQDIPASTRAALLDATASELEQRLWECNAVALSMALYSFGVASHSAPGVFEAARRHVVRLLGDLGPHEAANIAWAYAKAEHRAPEVFDALASVAPGFMPRFKPMELSQLAWAFATSGHEAPSVLSAVECEALRRQQQPGSLRLQPRELVTLAWSFAKAERLAPALMGTVLEGVEPAIVDSARGLNSQGLAMAAWSFARLGHPAPGLFAALATEVERRGLSDFQPQGLAMMAWAYARAGEGSGEGREAGGRLLGEIFSLVLDGDRRQWLLADFGPQGLAMLLWSAARTKHHSAPDLAEAAAEQLVPRAGGGREPLGDLSLRGLAMLAHACAAAGNMKNCCGERKCGWHFLLEALIPHVESPEKLRGGAQRDLATVAWAFSVCYPHENVGQLERLFAVMEDEAAPRVGRGEFGPLSLSMLMHSYARLRLPGSRLLEAAELPVRRMCSELPGECLGAQDCNATPGDLVVFAWCYARSGHRAAASVLPALAKQLAAPGWLAELSPLELTHIAWAYSGTAACAGSPVTPAGENPPVVSRLLDAICNQAMPKLTEFTDLGLATLAWAFANAGHPAPALFEAVACDVYRRLPALNPQCIATLTWAFARANESQSRPELINRLLDCVRPQLAEMGPQSLAMLLWSVAKAKHQADNFFAAAHPLVLERLCDFDSQGLAKVLWAFAVGSSLPTGEMFLRACEQAVPQLKEPLKAGSMAMALDAFEEAGADTGALHEAWRLRLLRDIYSGTP